MAAKRAAKWGAGCARPCPVRITTPPHMAGFAKIAKKMKKNDGANLIALRQIVFEIFDFLKFSFLNFGAAPFP